MLTRTGFGRRRAAASWWLGLAMTVAQSTPAFAQLDPLLFLKRTQPNVLIVVDTSVRMQRDADNIYYDPNTYTKTGAAWERNPGLNVTSSNTNYRRKYVNLANTDTGAGSDKFAADSILVVGDQVPGYAGFWSTTRLAVARGGIARAITDNQTVARFGLLRMRQSNPAWGTEKNEGPVVIPDSNPAQQDPTELTSKKWNITRPTVSASNGSIVAVQSPLVSPDAGGANTSVLTILARGVGTAGALIPAGNNSRTVTDAPVKFMLDDARAEAARLIGADTQCRNTIVVLVVGGGEGNSAAGSPDPAATASTFLNVTSRRVPIYVIAIAPPAADVPQLQNVAANSGGQYFEITKAMIDAACAAAVVPEVARAVNVAVQHAFAEVADFNTAPSAGQPYGKPSEFQVTSPIIGTVNLENANDITGAPLVNTVVNDEAGTKIPQRANVMVTSAFSLPGFYGQLRAFRVYKPVVDATTVSGYEFQSDGTRLWVAGVPAAASRNIYTVLPDGTLRAFTTGNAAVLAPYMNMTESAAGALIDYVRGLPLGAIVDSTPAIMDPPSVDSAPDADYPGFVAANKNRRSLVWVGTNEGLMHAIDARLGTEVLAFVPFNLLPKLKSLQDGQAVGDFDYMMDGSPKVADVKVSAPCDAGLTSCWRTYLFVGEGPGGTFYQTFDVTCSDMASFVSATNDNINDVLGYFTDPSKILFKWAFPTYASFDYTLLPYGDIRSTATPTEKSVGQTWSDPAVGQFESSTGKYAVVAGSGFLPYSTQSAANRGGAVAGTTLYLLNVETGEVYDSVSVGSDGQGETTDSCALANDCTKIKNALQADPVATGPPDSRFITRIYLGDLDGRVWRFNVGMNSTSGLPYITQKPALKLFDATNGHPIFSSMATVNVGSTQQYVFFGSGSDLLPSNGVSLPYKLFGVLDQGASGAQKFAQLLAKVDSSGDDEKVTSFPAVAGDIVFFTTTTFRPATPCTAPDAKLHALTFTGGPAYDNTGDNTITGADTTLVKTIAGARATAPFVVDQHVAFGASARIELFGDPADYNNGVGQVGVRILSWREVR
jgi:hypothetical protein